MKKSPRVIIIGIWILFAATALYFGINYLKGLVVFSSTHSYYVKFANVSGMSIASPIYINGYKVGTVQDMIFDMDDGGTTTLKLSIKKQHRLPKDTRAVIHQSLLGGAQIDLYLGKDQRILESGDTLRPAPKEIDPMEVINDKVLPYVEALLPKIDSILTAWNKISNDPSIKTTMTKVQEASERANIAIAKLDRIVGEFHEVVQTDVPRITSNLSASTEHLSNFSVKLDSVNLVTITDNLEQTSSELKTLVNKVNEGDGSLSKVLNDQELYMRIDSLVNSADLLINDIKAHPKKYLKISIF